jgi:exopolysaccharide production protein ExoQ
LPPTLALALCLLFIFILLRSERREDAAVSRALWVPTIWLLVTASKPLGVWFQLKNSDLDQASPLDLVFQVGLMLAAIAILNARRFDWSGAVRENKWLMALIAFMLLSTLWSDLPAQTLRRSAKELLAVLLAFVVLSEPSPRRALESILRRATYVLIPLSPILIKYFPQYGRLYTPWSGAQMWTGVANHKNSLAQICIISAAFLIWSLVRRRQGHNPAQWKYQTHAEIILLALCFWLLGGPDKWIFYSATSVYALTAGLLFYVALALAKKIKLRLPAILPVMIIALIIIVGTVSVFTSGSSLTGFASAARRDTTLTGRTQVWDSLVPVVKQSPWIGKGFGVFWTNERRNLFQIANAHNGYLEVLLGVGFIGLALLAAFLISSVRKAHRELSRDFDWGAFWICILLMAVVHNMGEPSFDSFANFQTAVLLFITVSSTAIIRARGPAG